MSYGTDSRDERTKAGTPGVDWATLVLVVCALVVTVSVVWREFRPMAQAAPSRIAIQSDWEQYAVSEHVIGDPQSRVIVVAFGDYECPACQVFQDAIDSLLVSGRSFKLLYRHYPLRNHRFAVPAARASQCAADQGRFGEMHRILYRYRDSLGLAPWSWYATLAGVDDLVTFDTCLTSPLSLRSLARDTVAGHKLGIVGTPTVLVGPVRLTGVPPFDSLRSYVDREAARVLSGR